MSTLTEALIAHGVLPMEKALSLASMPGGEEELLRSLLAAGELNGKQLARARASVAGLDYVDLVNYPVDPSAVRLVPAAVCRRHEVLPVGFRAGALLVAMANPGDILAVDDVRVHAQINVVPIAVERSDLLASIDRYHRADSELQDLKSSLTEADPAQPSPGPELFRAPDADAPIIRYVNLLVSQAIQDKASDVHIEPGESDVRIRYRIDGVLHEMQSAPASVQNELVSRLKIMSEIDIAERRRPQDGRMSIKYAERTIDLRVATLPTVWGEKVVMRILDTAQSTLTLEDLNLMPHNAEVFAESYNKPYGMVLVTGPTGSGKSTTLYTTLQEVARPEINVITVEDPVEYRMAGINQVQVNKKAGLTFPSALRSMLRSDPDVILIGEIRDSETAQIAIEASLTGHMVLSTLHTNDAPGAITRLTEMGVEPFLVGTALDCVVAQRLARRLCDHCKAPAQFAPGELSRLKFRVSAHAEPPTLFQPVGCANCSNTGYRGRVALHEVMAVTEEVERLAVKRAPSSEIGRVAAQQGMLTLRQDGWEKAKLGITTIDEILRVVA